MTVLPILRWPDPRLAQACAAASLGPELERLADDMLDTMYAAAGRGLAAPQVGRMLRLFVMDANWKEGASAPQVFVNPRILAQSDATAELEEGCLSIPGIAVPVRRPATVTLGWTALDGTAHKATFDGFAAACVQHEHDHLDGIVTLDRSAPAARAAALAAYAA